MSLSHNNSTASPKNTAATTQAGYLRSLQESFQAHLLNHNKNISELIIGDKELIRERVGIYQHNFMGCMEEVLSKDYAVLMQWMGEDSFFEMMDQYLVAYPSHYFTVELVGQHMAEFLRSTQPYQSQPYLSELADFVWNLSNTIDAADGPVLTMDQITAIPQESWAEMHISLHPSVSLMGLQWNTLPIWQSLNQNQEAPEPKPEEGFVAVWRQNLQPYYNPLTKMEAQVLQDLQDHRNFGEICENLLQWLPEDQVAPYAVKLLLHWLNNKMLSEVNL